MTVAARQAAIRDFSSRPDIPVMLVSLKAASLGVNLVSANHVVVRWGAGAGGLGDVCVWRVGWRVGGGLGPPGGMWM